MKKILLFFTAGLLLVNCNKNEDTPTPNEVVKQDLKPVSVVVKQGETVVENALTDGKITLERGKNYIIEVTFSQDVELQQGTFLKMKAKNNKEFYANFYGRNLNTIEESTRFKKDGYNDFVLQIVQSPIVADHYIEIKPVMSWTATGIPYADPDQKTIWTISRRQNDQTLVDVTFVAPVIIKNLSVDGTEVIKVEKKTEDTYRLTISNSKIASNAENFFTLPIYKDNNGEEGEQVGALTIRGLFQPYSYGYSGMVDTIAYYPNYGWYPTQIPFRVQYNTVPVFVDNINTEIIERMEVNVSGVGIVKPIFKDDAPTKIKGKVRIFDVYEGEVVGGEVVKKANSVKREIFASNTSN